MIILKGYVRNHYRSEGCIAEKLHPKEAIEFCSEYEWAKTGRTELKQSCPVK